MYPNSNIKVLKNVLISNYNTYNKLINSIKSISKYPTLKELVNGVVHMYSLINVLSNDDSSDEMVELSDDERISYYKMLEAIDYINCNINNLDRLVKANMETIHRDASIYKDLTSRIGNINNYPEIMDISKNELNLDHLINEYDRCVENNLPFNNLSISPNDREIHYKMNIISDIIRDNIIQ